MTIVIVSWNVKQLLRQCLLSILAQLHELDLEVIVVDNASTDETPNMVRSEFPQVRLVNSSENLGFPKANNLGIAMSGSCFVMLLNPDTVLRDGALQSMVSFLNDHPDVGVVGPQLLFPDGTIQSSRRRFPSVLVGMLESTWLQSLASKRTLDHYYALDLADDAVADVDWVVGAAMMVRRKVVEDVGGLDEAYFMYSEELDWCRRIKGAGWRVVYYPLARIVHHEGKSSEQVMASRHIYFQRAKLRYFRKYHGRAVSAMIRSLLIANYGLQVLAEALKWVLGHQREVRARRLRIYVDVLKTGLRPAGY